jgi:hypothetical protein
MHRGVECCSGICVYGHIVQKYVSCDARSSQEKADSLVQQLLEEHELDSKQPDVADEIAQRLARLRGQDTSSSHISTGEKKVPCTNILI